MKSNYIAPEAVEIQLAMSQFLLAGSGNSTGEDVSLGSEYDPWQ